MEWLLRRGQFKMRQIRAQIDHDFSGLIVEYLIKKYGNGRFTVPDSETEKQLDDRYFSHFAEGTFLGYGLVCSLTSALWTGSLMPPLVMKLLFSTMYTRSPFFIKPVVSMLTGGVNAGYIDPNLKNMFGMIDTYLAKDGGRDWLAGQQEPTAADFMVSLLAALLKPLEADTPMTDELPDRGGYQWRASQ